MLDLAPDTTLLPSTWLIGPWLTLKAERSHSSSLTPRVIERPSDVYDLVSPILSCRDREYALLIPLDTKHAIIGIHLVSIGTLNEAAIHPREIYKTALLHNSAAIILAHNHPSGDPAPSSEDRQVTDRLEQCGKLLGIPLLDHIIVAPPRWYSFADQRDL